MLNVFLIIISHILFLEGQNRLNVSSPFQGYIIYLVRNKLQALCCRQFPQISFKFVFAKSHTIDIFFLRIDYLSFCAQISFVIVFVQTTESSIFVQISGVRESEHKRLSNRTNTPLINPSFTAIRNHTKDRNQGAKYFCFGIVFKAKNISDAKI